MSYDLVCSKEFFTQNFKGKSKKEALLNSTALIFDHNDKLHERYLKKYFPINTPIDKFHLIPCVKGFKEFAIKGFGYGLIPTIDIKEELDQSILIQPSPS